MDDIEIEELFGDEWDFTIEMFPILSSGVIAEVAEFDEFYTIQIQQNDTSIRNIVLQFDKVLQELINTF